MRTCTFGWASADKLNDFITISNCWSGNIRDGPMAKLTHCWISRWWCVWINHHQSVTCSRVRWPYHLWLVFCLCWCQGISQANGCATWKRYLQKTICVKGWKKPNEESLPAKTLLAVYKICLALVHYRWMLFAHSDRHNKWPSLKQIQGEFSCLNKSLVFTSELNEMEKNHFQINVDIISKNKSLTLWC